MSYLRSETQVLGHLAQLLFNFIHMLHLIYSYFDSGVDTNTGADVYVLYCLRYPRQLTRYITWVYSIKWSLLVLNETCWPG